MSAIRVHGEGESSFVRQTFTDDNGVVFTGTQNDAVEFFRKQYPQHSIVITVCPRKRQKNLLFYR